MFSFVLPFTAAPISNRRHQPARCTLDTPATPRKRLKRWEQLTNSINESGIPPEFLNEIKRLVRGMDCLHVTLLCAFFCPIYELTCFIAIV